MRLSRHLLAGLLALPLAVGGGASQAADLVKIRMAYVVPVSNIASILFAKDGIAKHLGKTYEFEGVRFQGTPPMITALATGDLQIGLLAYSTLGLAVQNAGMTDLRIIADEIQDGAPGYYTNKFLVPNDSGIKTMADLKGKVIATNAAGSAVDIAVRAMLIKAGLDDKKDLTIVEAGFPNMKAMLKEKKISFAPAVLPFSEDPELLAANHVLFTQRDAMGTSELAMLVARKPFIEKNRAAMVDLLEDTVRAVRWYIAPENRAEAIKYLAAFTKLPPERFEGWLFSADKDYYRDPDVRPNLEALRHNIQVQRELGFIKADIDPTKYADLSMLDEALKRIK
jgi:sulfonate transport system substrate-binding protein